MLPRLRGLNAFVALAWLAVVPVSMALDPGKTIFQYHCQGWTRQSGLASGGINAIAQTKDGFIWLGTQKQLVRFDGLEFKIMPLPHNPLFRRDGISSLSASAEGDLWFGILRGAFGVYRHDGGFAPLTNQSWANPQMRVTAVLAARDGSVWIAAGESVLRCTSKPNTIQSFNFDQVDCGGLFEDSKGRIWLSMLGRGLFYYDLGRMISFPDPALSSRSAFVFGISEDSDGRFWFATSLGPRVYDANFQPRPGPEMDLKTPCLLVDHEGSVWFGTDGDGLYCWRHRALTIFRKANGLVDDHVSALFEDRDGNLWVGTRGGLNLLSDVRFPLYSPAGAEQSASFHSVCASARGGFWAGANIGLFRFDGDQFTCYSTNAGLATPWLKQVFEASDSDVYLANGSQEVEIFRDGKVVARHKCPTWQTGFAEDKQGVVVGCGGDLFRVSRAGITPYAFTNPAPQFQWIRSMNTAWDGSLLIASVNGIYRVNGVIAERLAENGLPTQEALWAYEESAGVLWAGLSDGVARIAGTNVDSWTQESGLFDKHIRGIIPDDNGWLWFHSEGGIFRVRRDSFIIGGHKAARLNCEAFDGVDSVETLETADLEYCACKTRDGQIWIPSPQGMILVDPARVSRNASLPLAHIETIQVNGKVWSSAQSSSVAPGKGELEVYYTAPAFVTPQRQQFRYKLEGYESEWEKPTTHRWAQFINLKPGKYKFLVQSCASDGTATGRTDSFEIELMPFFYQTRWFYAVCTVAALVTLIGAYSWRVRALKHRQEWLEAEVGKQTAQLTDKTILLEKEIEERKEIQREVERVHRKLLETSRLAGMAEVATGVLHSVGNVLNSVNVSATLLTERIKDSKLTGLRSVVELLEEHKTDLIDFFYSNPKAQQLPKYLGALSHQLEDDRTAALDELTDLVGHVDQVKKIVAMQQNCTRVTTVTTVENVIELVEDSLRMNEAELEQHRVAIVRNYQDSMPEVALDRHKVMGILLDLIRNAMQACIGSEREDKQITVRLAHMGQQIQLAISDNGVGIPAENFTRIFNHGFTTRKDGYGFGLHYAALAAKEMNGNLRAQSDGPGKGAMFVLELPANAPAPTASRMTCASA